MQYDVTLHPLWWHRHPGIDFSQAFFDEPQYRMESDVKMRRYLYWPHKAAPYVCIEPWCSLQVKADKTTVFEERKDLLRLEAGKAYENCWSIEIN